MGSFAWEDWRVMLVTDMASELIAGRFALARELDLAAPTANPYRQVRLLIVAWGNTLTEAEVKRQDLLELAPDVQARIHYALDESERRPQPLLTAKGRSYVEAVQRIRGTLTEAPWELPSPMHALTLERYLASLQERPETRLTPAEITRLGAAWRAALLAKRALIQMEETMFLES